jgi:Zn-dependent peptidase ImmA (M78 family)
MRFLAAKARRLRVGWGKRPLTEDDFHQLREQHGVLLLEVDNDVGRTWFGLKWKGYYTTVDGVPAIVINKELRGLERLRVLLHEFGHHLLHAPETCFFSDSSIEKTEVEAEIFALVALIPKSMLPRLMSWNLFDEDEDLLPVRLLKRRKEIYDLYGI